MRILDLGLILTQSSSAHHAGCDLRSTACRELRSDYSFVSRQSLPCSSSVCCCVCDIDWSFGFVYYSFISLSLSLFPPPPLPSPPAGLLRLAVLRRLAGRRLLGWVPGAKAHCHRLDGRDVRRCCPAGPAAGPTDSHRRHRAHNADAPCRCGCRVRRQRLAYSWLGLDVDRVPHASMQLLPPTRRVTGSS